MERILQLSSKFPLPADEGSRIATWNLSRCLCHNGYKIDLVCFAKDPQEVVTHSIQLATVFASVEAVQKDVKRQYFSALLKSIAIGEPYLARKYTSGRVIDILQERLSKCRYDFTLLEQAFMGVYLPLLKKSAAAGRIILREHNVEYEILERMASQERRLLHRTLLRREAARFRRFEFDLVRNVSEVYAISQRDADILTSETGVRSVKVLDPFIDTDVYAPSSAPPQPFTVVTVANLSWIPNANGMVWFCRYVWPRVIRIFPEAKLYIVGKNPPARIRHLDSRTIIVTGQVADEKPYLRVARLFIVPLFEGSGVRIKILTAMAMGKEVLTTPLGAEGIAWPGLIIRASAEQWAETILACFRTPVGVAHEAVDYVCKKHHWKRPLKL